MTVEALAALHAARPFDADTSRLTHATVLAAQTLERWWLPWLDDLIDGQHETG